MTSVNTTEHRPFAFENQPQVLDTSNLSHEYLSFCLGGEEYGIDLLKVQEIRGYELPTRMAGTPEFVKGVLNLRGVIVPILDLRIRFGFPDAKYDALTITVILCLKDRVVGIVVDSVSDVVELSAEQIKPAPQFHGHLNANSIIGLSAVEEAGRERMLILLDIEELMRSSDMGLVPPQVQ